jgi:hypothetical protein
MLQIGVVRGMPDALEARVAGQVKELLEGPMPVPRERPLSDQLDTVLPERQAVLSGQSVS